MGKKREDSSVLKISSNKVVPSVLKMMEEDSELKDFFRLIKENGFRDQAVALLNERLQKQQLPKQ